MATLNSSNIITGNTVESNDILQLYDALTAGGGSTGAYDVSISGSLLGTASYALTASYVETTQTASYVTLAQTSSYVTLAQTASYVTLSQTASYVTLAQTASYVTLAQTASFVQTAQTASYVLSASFAVSSSRAVSSSFATTASYAVTASYALNMATTQWNTTTANNFKIPPGRDVGVFFNFIGTNSVINLYTSSLFQIGDKVTIIVTSSNTFGLTVDANALPAKILVSNSEGTSVTTQNPDSYWQYICVASVTTPVILSPTPIWRLVQFSDSDTNLFGQWGVTINP